jgi:hypothetical protein
MCDVCSCIESGYDASLSDFEMTQCQVGHTFCNSHMSNKMKELTLDEMKEALKKSKYYSNYADKDDDFVEEGYNEMINDEGSPSLNCPVCQLTVLPDSEMVSYLLYKLSAKREDIVAEVKSAFGTYEKFRDTVLKGKK